MLIITGLSGAGKSIAMKTLEDLGYYCVDNLPIVLLDSFINDFALKHHQEVAVAIDSRHPENIAQLPARLQGLKQRIAIKTLFLTADTDILARRFSETRRPHPLHLNAHTRPLSLPDAIELERHLLGSMINAADITLDTSTYSTYDLKNKLREVLASNAPDLMITLQSFGFKNGTPVNADFLFDVRFLPNPYWKAELRDYSGDQQPVRDYLDSFAEPRQFAEDTAAFLLRWLPDFVQNGNRAYLTVCIGCTGGQHRSVYITERIAAILKPHFPGLMIEHRDRKPHSATL